jgi:nucleoside-diphosphate-sugar epimerase
MNADRANFVKNLKTPVTVLGAQGYVGSHLVAYLKANGVEPQTPGRDDARLFKDDLGTVFYCIGLTADYAARPFDTVEAHSSLISNILKKSKFSSLVYLSSTRLYDSGNGEGNEAQDLILNPNNPRHLYDFSKGLGESVCLTTGQGKARVARLASVYADDLRNDNFLHQILRRAKTEPKFTFDTAPDYARDYVHISDVCQILCAIAAAGKKPIYNVASGHNLSNSDLFKAVKRVNGADITAAKPASKMIAPRIDVSALHDDFGISPAQVEDHLARMLGAAKLAAKGA